LSGQRDDGPVVSSGFVKVFLEGERIIRHFFVGDYNKNMDFSCNRRTSERVVVR
jgi:hypothetical protein